MWYESYLDQFKVIGDWLSVGDPFKFPSFRAIDDIIQKTHVSSFSGLRNCS